MSLLDGPSQNFLLSAMPREVIERLCPDLERIAMPAGQVLCEPGVPIRDVCFPATSIVSMSYVMESGASAEVALIGREGMVGVPLLLGAASSTVQARVQSAGSGFRLAGRRLVEEFERGGRLMQVLLRYTGFLIGQMEQTAACNRHGTLEQRLCRWLLSSLDRLAGNELTMTHESIAHTLGVKREGVTEAAARLRHEGAIDYRRGHIEVLDRRILERRACSCYRNGEKRHARVQSDFARTGNSASARTATLGERGWRRAARPAFEPPRHGIKQPEMEPDRSTGLVSPARCT